MKILKSSVRMGLDVKKLMFVGAFALLSLTAFAQNNNNLTNNNPYAKLGQKALMDGDFKAAVANLEKALPSDPNNVTILYALGYSQYHSSDYKGAIKSFTKVVEHQPDYVSAYYYRGKAQNTLALQPNSGISDAHRAKLLTGSIEDYSKAIALDNKDTKLYQNRALAYRDLGNLTGTPSSKNYDAATAREAYSQCIEDLKYVLDKFPNRKDMALELKKAKVYRDNIK